MATENDLDEAVQAAREAFPIWKARPLEDRQQCLHRIADELENRQDGLRPILFQGVRQVGMRIPPLTLAVLGGWLIEAGVAGDSG